MEKQELYDIVREARQALRPTHPQAATLDNKVTDKTEQEYWKCVRRFFTKIPLKSNRSRATQEDNTEIEEVARFAYFPEDAEAIIKKVSSYSKASTIRTYATAIRYVSMRSLDQILKRIDRNQKDGNWEAAYRIASSKFMIALIRLARTLPEEYLKGATQRSPRKSKKQSLTGLPDDWRFKVIERADPEYQLAITMLALTGCRPEELAKGIRVTQREDGLYAEIHGAKVTQHAGQVKRTLKLHPVKASELLSPYMKGLEVMVVKFDQKNSLTTHIRSVAKKLWPRKKESVTSYCFKHAMSADCKASPDFKNHPESISMVLGHRVDRTRSYYGTGSQGNLDGMAPAEVTASHEVRITAKSLRALPRKSKNRSIART